MCSVGYIRGGIDLTLTPPASIAGPDYIKSSSGPLINIWVPWCILWRILSGRLPWQFVKPGPVLYFLVEDTSRETALAIIQTWPCPLVLRLCPSRQTDGCFQGDCPGNSSELAPGIGPVLYFFVLQGRPAIEEHHMLINIHERSWTTLDIVRHRCDWQTRCKTLEGALLWNGSISF